MSLPILLLFWWNYYILKRSYEFIVGIVYNHIYSERLCDNSLDTFGTSLTSACVQLNYPKLYPPLIIFQQILHMH